MWKCNLLIYSIIVLLVGLVVNRLSTINNFHAMVLNLHQA
jgi:hypothetical protein